MNDWTGKVMEGCIPYGVFDTCEEALVYAGWAREAFGIEAVVRIPHPRFGEMEHPRRTFSVIDARDEQRWCGEQGYGKMPERHLKEAMYSLHSSPAPSRGTRRKGVARLTVEPWKPKNPPPPLYGVAA